MSTSDPVKAGATGENGDRPDVRSVPFFSAPRPLRRALWVGFRNVTFALRPGVLFTVAARARYPLFASVVTQTAILVASIVLARAMGKQVFGQYGMILTIQVVFFTVSNLCLSSIMPAFIAPAREDKARVGTISATAASLTIGFSAAGVALFLAFLRTSTALCEIPHLKAATVLICVPVVAALPVQYVMLAEIQSMEQIGLWSAASAFVGITPIAASLLGVVWFGRIGLLGFSVFVAAGSLVALGPLLLFRRLSGMRPLRAAFDPAIAKELLRDGLSLWFICILCTAALSLARVFVVRHGGHGDAACFILAYGFVGYLQMFNGAFSVPWVPKWSRLARKRRRSKILRETRNAAISLLLVGSGYGIALFLFAPWFVPLIYGAQYEPAAQLVRILAATCPIIAIGFAAWTLFISQGAVRVVFWANVVWASVLTLSSVVLVPRHGPAGAAVAVVLAYACWGSVYAVCFVVNLREIASWKIGRGQWLKADGKGKT